jgi:hypothetical protein
MGNADSTNEMIWYKDSAHAWLRVSLPDVEASGYKPSGFSYRGDDCAYLEEDCDAPAYLLYMGLWDGERENLPQFRSNIRDGERRDVRRLPMFDHSDMWRSVLVGR